MYISSGDLTNASSTTVLISHYLCHLFIQTLVLSHTISRLTPYKHCLFSFYSIHCVLFFIICLLPSLPLLVDFPFSSLSSLSSAPFHLWFTPSLLSLIFTFSHFLLLMSQCPVVWHCLCVAERDRVRDRERKKLTVISTDGRTPAL